MVESVKERLIRILLGRKTWIWHLLLVTSTWMLWKDSLTGEQWTELMTYVTIGFFAGNGLEWVGKKIGKNEQN